jgi:hypothetical protein
MQADCLHLNICKPYDIVVPTACWFPVCCGGKGIRFSIKVGSSMDMTADVAVILGKGLNDSYTQTIVP